MDGMPRCQIHIVQNHPTISWSKREITSLAMVTPMVCSRFPQFFHGYLSGTLFFSVGSVLIVPILPLMWVPPTFRKFTPQATLRRVYLKMTGSRLAAIDTDVLMKLPWFMKINQQMVGLNNRNGGIIGTQWDIWYRECIWINEITTSRLATWTRNGA